MVNYEYNLIKDIQWSYEMFKKRKLLKKRNIVYFYPSIFRITWLLGWRLFYKDKSEFKDISNRNITCYWVHSGVWGSYDYPDNIYICPWRIEEVGGLQETIEHELKHLECWEKTKNMTFEQREEFINSD